MRHGGSFVINELLADSCQLSTSLCASPCLVTICVTVEQQRGTGNELNEGDCGGVSELG